MNVNIFNYHFLHILRDQYGCDQAVDYLDRSIILLCGNSAIIKRDIIMLFSNAYSSYKAVVWFIVYLYNAIHVSCCSSKDITLSVSPLCINVF